jgi:hypothetical protein
MNSMALTVKQIEEALHRTKRAQRMIVGEGGHSEHPDCVRICIAWFSAQRRGKLTAHRPIKHIIEAWGGRYVSMLDVMTAADMLDLGSRYERLRISSKFVFPSVFRISEMGQAFAHPNYCSVHDLRAKSASEEILNYLEFYKSAEGGEDLEGATLTYTEVGRRLVAGRSGTEAHECYPWSLCVTAE